MAGHTVGGTTIRSAALHQPTPAVHLPLQPATSRSQPTNRLALLAFTIVVLLGPVGAPIAVPMALVAGRQCTRTNQRGTGIAQASVFIAGAYFALGAVVVILRVVIDS